MDTLDIAYILLRFPHLTETFVADEIWEVQQQGIRVSLFSLLKPRRGLVQPTSKRLEEDTRYAPELWSWRLWWAQLYFLARSPFVYLALLTRLVRQPYPERFLPLFLRRMLIFLKSVSLAYELRGTPIKLVHAHFAWLSGAAAWVISKLLDIPFTVTVHAYDLYSSNDLLRLTACSASRIVAISEYNRRMVLKMCPDLRESLISVIHCGINLERFVPPARSGNNGQGPLSILSVGSLIEKKGHEYLIRACQQLKARGMDFRCTIIGEGPDEKFLRQLVCDYGLEDRVVLAGARQQDDVLAAYRDSDLFVLASAVAPDGDRDGIPVVLMEAMAMQMPVISTPVSGIPELVRHGETGWLVPERDATAIADAIAHLAGDDKLRGHLAHNGRALVEREFEIRANVGRLISVFRQGIEEFNASATPEKCVQTQ